MKSIKKNRRKVIRARVRSLANNKDNNVSDILTKLSKKAKSRSELAYGAYRLGDVLAKKKKS